jgi:hypothetical protein
LRHTQQPFVVEVRRHRGRPTVVETKMKFEETFRDAARDAAYEADQTGLEANQAEKHAFEIDPTISSGRILPSLVETSPWTLPPAEAEPSRRLARRALRKDKPARPTEVVVIDVPKRRRATPPPGHADACSMIGSDSASQQFPQARSNDSPRVASGVVQPIDSGRSAAKSAASKKPRRRDDVANTDMSAQSTRLPIDLEPPPVPGARPTIPSGLEDGPSRERRRSIMARYVFGTELKPGERWKQRLRRTR